MTRFDDRIEISFDVIADASVCFSIDRNEWERMSESEREKRMAEAINSCQRTLDDAEVSGTSGSFYASITNRSGPYRTVDL